MRYAAARTDFAAQVPLKFGGDGSFLLRQAHVGQLDSHFWDPSKLIDFRSALVKNVFDDN